MHDNPEFNKRAELFMYPYDIIPGLDLYSIMFCVGIIAAMVTFRLFSDRRGFSARLNNFVIADGVACVILGYASAVLFQAVYNAIETGKFEITKYTGATFYGGFIGGAAVYFAFYFIVGHFAFGKDGEHRKNIGAVVSICAASVCIAHSFGRIGCLFAGCCYGRITTSPISVYNAYLDARVVPVQLFEALFLAALFAYLCFRIEKKQDKCLAIYLASYGVWRFFIEYFRTDDRGGSLVSFLTPSQLIAVVLTLVGILLFAIETILQRRAVKEPKNA